MQAAAEHEIQMKSDSYEQQLRLMKERVEEQTQTNQEK